MANKEMAAIVLAAGRGTRMNSDLPKVLHKVAGRAIISHLLDTLDQSQISNIIVVVSPNSQEITSAVYPHKTVVQEKPLGTGNAVLSAYTALKEFRGDLTILCGDVPLISVETLKAISDKRSEGFDLVLVGFKPADGLAYGRIVTSPDGSVSKIVEFLDATEEERGIKTCNSGLMCGDAQKIFSWLKEVRPNNAKGEYYLTDMVGIAKESGCKVGLVLAKEEEVMGVNTLKDLANLEQTFQNKRREEFMLKGVQMISPDTVYFSYDTEIEPGVIIEPYVFFGLGVKVCSGTLIKSFSYLEGASVERSCNIGPFCRLRPQAEIKAGVHIGNFVEVKKSVIEEGSKVNHLSYIGDARVGSHVNIGAGTITCNYDGFTKKHTDIGSGSFIGSNTCLVAPVSIGEGSIIGAGSTITHNVGKDSLALTRTKQEEKEGWALKYRTRKSKKKEDQ